MTLQTYTLFVQACFAINMAFGPNKRTVVVERRTRRGAGFAARGVRADRRDSDHDRYRGTRVRCAPACFADALYDRQVHGRRISRLDRRQAVRSRQALIAQEQGASRGPASLKRLTRQEFLVAAGNPKAILVFTAFFPQFVDRDAYAASFAILGAIFLLLELVAIVIYATLGARLGLLSKGARGFFKWFNRVSESLMIGFGVMLAFVRRPAS